MPVDVARLEVVPLREVWKDEARDFTPWLAENPEPLAEALHMDLELVDKEVAVGPFSADLVFREVASDHIVVVENFLEKTDHDHLGKLITYASGLDARWAVLVAKSFRPEHRTALTWLNSISEEGSGFFGVEVRAVRIGTSQPAVQLDVVVEPDDFVRQVRANSTALSDSSSRYREWWAEFLPHFHEAFPGWSNARSPSTSNWMNFPAGRSDVNYVLSFSWGAGATNYSMRAEVYLRDGQQQLEQLLAQRADLESNCGLQLSWEPIENAKASRIAVYLDPADPDDRDNWPEYRSWAIGALGELRQTFGNAIAALDAVTG